jgi:hypothetical protein
MIDDSKGNEVILRGIGPGGWMLQEPYMVQLNGIPAHQTSKGINRLKILVLNGGFILNYFQFNTSQTKIHS